MQTLKLTKKYETYPEYKDSGVEWLGKIPKNWDLASSRQLFNSEKERVGSNFSDHKILSLTLRGVIPRILDGSGKNPAEYDTYQVFNKEDLVFCLFDYDVTPRTIGYVEQNGMMTGAYTRLIPRSETYSKYFYYYFLSLDYKKDLLHLCTGLRNSLSKPIFWSMKSSLPDLKEQEKIAKYLNGKTSLIDQIIEKKHKQIELLREKRSAVINQAVTKGLDFKAEFVESGIDWIGKIPKGWEVDKVNHRTLANTGGVWGEDDPTENGKIVLRSTEINQNGSWDLNNAITRKLTMAEFKKAQLFADDLLITKSSGSSDHLGKTAIVSKQIENMGCAYSNFMQRLRLNNTFLPKYFFYLINNKIGRDQINYWGLTTSGLVNLNASLVGKFVFPIPPINEQKSISQYLDKKTECFDQLIAKVEKSIGIMQEFKASLISNVVTGKIKV